MKIFDVDSPLMQALSKVSDLVILNLLTLACCLPVITIGPALTALNHVALKIARNEETYITKSFFKSFKENFRQGVLIWLLFLALGTVLVCDYFILLGSDTRYASVMQVLILVAAAFVIFTFLYTFPVLARFHNTIKATLKNAFMISVAQFPKTILMFVMYLIPLLVFLNFFQLIPFVLFFGLSVPAWGSAKLYQKFFKKLEDSYWERHKEEAGGEEQADGEEDVRIFRDELDETLQDKTRQ